MEKWFFFIKNRPNFCQLGIIPFQKVTKFLLIRDPNLKLHNQYCHNEGHGISNGLIINMIFCGQEGVPIFHNVEVAPATGHEEKESQLSMLTLSVGDELTSCNK